MTTTASYNRLSLVELANRMDPDGDLSLIAEVLTEENEWMMDAVWTEANDTFSHQTTKRSSLPSGSWRKINEGVAVEASQTIEITDNIGMLETYSEVDKALADAAPNKNQFRNDEARAFLEGLAQTLASTFIYGNANTDTEKFHGLAPRMASLAATANVIGEGGTGSDLTSVFLVNWGTTKVHMVYPRGSSLGISRQDLGEVTLQDSSSNNYQGYREHFSVKAGLVVRDDKCIARLANIESTGSSNTFDEDNIILLKNRMRNGGKGSVMLGNATVKSQMEIKLKDKANVFYSAAAGEGLFGEEVIKGRGMPLRLVDQILITEDALT
jgi:hypothetical protein